MSTSAKAVFEADSSKLDAALVRIQSSMLRLQRGAAGLFVAFKSLQAAGALISAQFQHVKAAIHLGGELDDMSARTGIAVAELAILRQEFANAGKAAEDVGPTIAKMQRSLLGGKGVEMIEKLGINLDELKSKTPTEQFHTLGAAIGALENPLDRVKASTAIFGKSGTDLLSVFSGGNFGEAAEHLGSQAQILQRNSSLFDDVSNRLNLAGVKVQGFFVGVADKIAPVLKPLLDQFAKMDFARLGQQVGEIIAFLIQSFADGSIGDIVLQTLKIALAQVGNFALGIFTGLGKVLWQLLAEGVTNAIFMLEVVTKPNFWLGLGNALISSAQMFVAMMLEGVAQIIGALRHVPGIGKGIGAAADRVSNDAKFFRDQSLHSSQQSINQFTPIFHMWKDRMFEEIVNVVGAMKEGFGEGMSVFDTDSMNAELEGMMSGVFKRVAEVTEKSLADSPVRQINAVGEQLTSSENERVSHLQRIGGGGLAGADSSPFQEQKRTNTILGDVRGLLKEIKGKLNPPSSPTAALFG